MVGNSLICISEGAAEPEGGRGGWDWKPGLGGSIPGVSAVISEQRVQAQV